MQTDTLAIIEHRLSSIESSHDELKDAIKDLTVAINKLAIIDERQVQSALILDKLSSSVDKAHMRIDGLQTEFAKALHQAKVDCHTEMKSLTERMSKLEIEAPLNKQTSQWVFNALWGFAGLAAAGIFHKILNVVTN